MIRVIVTGPPVDGKFPYRVEGQTVANNGVPITQMASWEPLLEACRLLKHMGEPDDRMVGLYQEGEAAREPGWSMRTSVGYGSRYKIADPAPLTDAPTATPEEPPPPPRTPPDQPADTGPAEPEPAKTAKSHRQRKRGASGARRGSR